MLKRASKAGVSANKLGLAPHDIHKGLSKGVSGIKWESIEIKPAPVTSRVLYVNTRLKRDPWIS